MPGNISKDPLAFFLSEEDQYVSDQQEMKG